MSKVLYCPKCKTSVMSRFCQWCGTETVAFYVKCPFCEQDTNIKAPFCGACGRPVHQEMKAILAEMIAKQKGGSEEQKLECGEVSP